MIYCLKINHKLKQMKRAYEDISSDGFEETSSFSEDPVSDGIVKDEILPPTVRFNVNGESTSDLIEDETALTNETFDNACEWNEENSLDGDS